MSDKEKSSLEKWIDAVLHEDGDNLSIGSVRSMQMIRQEMKSLYATENELRELNEGLRLDRNTYRDAWEDRQQEVSDLKVERDRYKEALDSIKNHCITFPFSDNNDIYEICTKTIDTETTNTKQP